MEKNQLSPNLPVFSLNLTPFPLVDQAKTLAPLPGPGYELRSQGPPTLGTNVLDNLVSDSRRSSSIPAPPPPATTPPASPSSSAASIPSPMAEPTNAELARLIQTLTASISDLQGQMAVLQQECPAAASFSGSRGSGNGDHHGDRPPRFQKLDFPKFDGKSDPLAFLNRCESYFHQQRIAAEEQVWMASYNLEAGAQMWFIQVQQDEGTPSWRRFSELLNLRFGPPIRFNPLGELMACKRTGSVAEYQDRFEALLPRAGTLTEAQRVQAFTAGLQPPLSLDVELHNPQSLIIAMSLARELELREQYTAVAAPLPALQRPQARGLLPAPLPRLALPAPPTGAGPSTGSVEG